MGANNIIFQLIIGYFQRATQQSNPYASGELPREPERIPRNESPANKTEKGVFYYNTLVIIIIVITLQELKGFEF